MIGRLYIPVLVSLHLCGCMPVFYPHLDRVPSLVPDMLAESESALETTYAFRIDAIEYHWGRDGQRSSTYCTLLEVPPGQRQWALNVDYGWVGCLDHKDITVKGMAVRLYRPGFAVVQLERGQPPGPIAWQKLHHWREEEKALDDLLAPPTAGRAQNWYGLVTETPTWLAVNDGHKQALQFVAGEYDRLAAQLPPSASPQDRQRLLAKSKYLEAAATATVPMRFRIKPPYP
jgi:hypothetical protein